MDVARKLVGGALGTLSLAVDAARHVVWLFGYHVDRRTRDADGDD